MKTEWTKSMIRSEVSEIIPKSMMNSYLDLLLGPVRPSLIKKQEEVTFAFSETLIEQTAMTFATIYELQELKKSQNVFSKISGKFRKDEPILARAELFTITAGLKYGNSLTLLKEIPYNSRQLALRELKTDFSSSAYVLTSMLHKIGVDLDQLHTVEEEDVLEFNEHIREAYEKSVNPPELYVDDPSEQFNIIASNSSIYETLNYYRNPFSNEPHPLDLSQKINEVVKLFKDVKPTLLTLFKVYYSEELVLEVLELMTELDASVSPLVIMDVLDNWEELKIYPIQWIIETRVYS